MQTGMRWVSAGVLAAVVCFAGARPALAHKARGSFEVATVSGTSQLRFGKDLSADKGGPTGLSLGKLKQFSGEQTLAIPAGTDLAGYPHVVLWCRKSDATLGATPLASADGVMHK
jgi:hypothetical protein